MLILQMFAGIVSCKKEIVYLPEDDSFIPPFGTESVTAVQGQPFLIACELQISEHAKSVVVEWDCDSEGFVQEDSRNGNISYKEYNWDTPGDKVVTCRISYIYGNENKTLEHSETFKVIP